MIVMIPISIGELIDKLSILKIKLKKIADPSKLINIRLEHDMLTQTLDQLNVGVTHDFIGLSDQLQVINNTLWEVEDDIREYEHQNDFGSIFITLARSVYRLNDKRSLIKKQINELFGSTLKEEKSYKTY